MFDFNLFYLVFLGQVLLLSWYYPRKLLGQMQFVADNYPPDQYPKLYPKSSQHYANSRTRFRWMNLLIFAAGLALLYWFMSSTRDTSWDGPRITWFYLLQLLPVVLLDLSSMKNLRLMRLADDASIRQAELKPRRLFDFVSPVLFGFALAVYVTFCLFIAYMGQFDFPWFGGYTNVVMVTIANVFLAAIGWRFLRGRKLDPHQSPEDRSLKIQNILNVLVLTSIALTLYAFLTITLAALELRHLQPVTLSAYFQILALISFQAYRIDGRDFEVYRHRSSVA